MKLTTITILVLINQIAWGQITSDLGEVSSDEESIVEIKSSTLEDISNWRSGLNLEASGNKYKDTWSFSVNGWDKSFSLKTGTGKNLLKFKNDKKVVFLSGLNFASYNFDIGYLGKFKLRHLSEQQGLEFATGFANMKISNEYSTGQINLGVDSLDKINLWFTGEVFSTNQLLAETYDLKGIWSLETTTDFTPGGDDPIGTINVNALAFNFYGNKKGVIGVNGEYKNFSDVRLKKDISDLPKISNKVMALRPVRYHYNHQSEKEKKSIGFIAQEVETQFPELVNDGDLKSLSYKGFGVLAIKMIQEQQELMESQLSQIQKLKEELRKLQKKT